MDFEIFKDVLFNLIPLIVAVIGANLAARQLFELKRVKKSGKDSIYNTLDQKFDSKLINDKEDIQLIINSFSCTEDEFYSIAPNWYKRPACAFTYLCNYMIGIEKRDIEILQFYIKNY